MMDEKIEKILNKLFENLEEKTQATKIEHITLGGVASDIKEVGEALNALATGLDNYRKVSWDITQAANPSESAKSRLSR